METTKKQLDAVKIVSLFGYWHLHRKLNGKNYFGYNDHRIGLSIRTETDDKVKDWEPKVTDEPYTEDQIKSFANLTFEELEQ